MCRCGKNIAYRGVLWRHGLRKNPLSSLLDGTAPTQSIPASARRLPTVCRSVLPDLKLTSFVPSILPSFFSFFFLLSLFQSFVSSCFFMFSFIFQFLRQFMCGIFVRSFVLVLPLVFQRVNTPESCKGSVTFVTQMYIDYLAQVRLVFYQPRSAYETT